LLENVGAEIDPIRLIRRIKNGLEIPGLKPALIKILHDFNLQISLLEGCQAILYGDSSDLAKRLHRDQATGFLLTCKFLGPSSFCTPANHKLYQRKPYVRFVTNLYRSHRHPSYYFFSAAMPSMPVMWTAVTSFLLPLIQWWPA
jgi:hypothetical protein